MGCPSLLSPGHDQGEAVILTLPVGGSFCGKLCRLVVLGAGADSVNISDYMGRSALLILRRPMLLSADLQALFHSMGDF